MILMIEQLLIHAVLVLNPLFDFFMHLQHTFAGDSKPVTIVTEQSTVLESNESLPLWGMPSDDDISLAIGSVTVEKAYEASELTEEHNAFLANLFIENCTEPQNPYSVDSEEDMLTMDQWSTEPTPVTVTRQLAATASAKVADLAFGEQLWVVEVIGEEQGYVHVSDGSARAWVDVASFGKILKGDILSLLIDRSDDLRIRALDADILQRRSKDFELVDEMEWAEEFEERELITA